MSPSLRPRLILVLKALVSLGLLAFLFSRTDLVRLLHVLSSTHLPPLLTALAAYFLGQLVSSFRWSVLARRFGFNNPFRDFAFFYFIGMFFNLFGPSTVGGDIGRVFYLARGATAPTAYAFISVLADRAVGLVVLVWIGATALLVFPQYGLPSAVRYATFSLALSSLLAWPIVLIGIRRLPSTERSWGRKLRLALENLRRVQRVFVPVVLLSLLLHFLQAWIHLLLGRAVGVDIPWSYSFVLYPLVAVFSALPISLNGIGLREGGYLFMLRQIEVDSEKGLAFGILWFLVVVVESLIGGVLFILRRGPRSTAIASGVEAQRR